jgi:hypothetical protein
LPPQALACWLLAPVRPRLGTDDPHFVHTMRDPNTGTGTSSGHGAALMIARWWLASMTHRATARRSRVLPWVIGAKAAKPVARTEAVL